jgi:hypothetical protein
VNVVSIEVGRATQILNQDEARPEQNTYLPQVIELARARYGFVGLPNLAETATKGVKFQQGRLLLPSGDAIWIEGLDIYNDGLAVSCRNTSDAEIVLSDAIEWGKTTFGLRQPKNVGPRLYQSFVIVDFKSSTSALISRFAEIQSLLSKAYQAAYSVERTFEVAKLSLMADPTTLGAYAHTEFSFDRRGGQPFGLNRFFCGAPLSTDEHIALLRELENLFG